MAQESTGQVAARESPRKGLRIRLSALENFSAPAFRSLFGASLLIALGNWGERLAVSWLVYIQSGSIFAAAATMAFRSAPSLLVAPFAGAAVDRWPRQRVIFASVAWKAALVLAVGLVAQGGISSPWRVLPLVALGGVANAFETAGIQALLRDIAGPRRSMSAISVQSTGIRLVGVLGALLAGIISDRSGASLALFGAAGALLLGGLSMLTVRSERQEPALRKTVLSDTVEGVRAIVSLPPVATLLVIAMVVEIFGFAFQSVLPAVAAGLGIKGTGYGSLTLMTGVGAVMGVALLSTLGDYPRKGALVIAIIVCFGLALIAFSSSSVYWLSLLLIMGVGACMAMFDAMQWVLVQANVPDSLRGRAVAAWVFAIGFGWIGHLMLGAFAEAVGVHWTLAASGAMLVITGVLAFFVFKRVKVG